MNLSITPVPTWVNISFALLFPIAVYLIGNIVKQAYCNYNGNEKIAKIMQRNVVISYTIYFVGVAIAALFGIFTVNTLPPRILLFTTLPLFIFYLFYVIRSDWFQIVLENATLQSLVFIHVFRFVGIFFLICYTYDALPRDFALAGGIGDIVAATLCLVVIYALNNKKSYAIPLTYLWNIIGILDILNVLFLAIITTRTAIENNEVGVGEFGTFPFAWIPAFAPATIIFLHIVVFKKLALIRKNRINKNATFR